METLESLRRRIQSAQDLYGIVRTMKALAAASIRQLERAVEATEAYNRAVDSGLRVVVQDRFATTGTAEEQVISSHKGRTLAILFGSDQGMCGQFNENIVSFALQDLVGGSREQCPVQMVVGIRAASYLEEMGSTCHEVFSVPGSVDGINPSVQALLLTINAWRERGSVEKVILYYNRPITGTAYQPTRIQLIPVDMNLFRAPIRKICPSSSLPMYRMDRERLLSALLRQYLFAQVYRAYAESLASENASRLVTMQAAEKNIEERLAELNALYHGQRQGAITSELLDIVSGVEALSGGG
ncbi:MAG: F0F1 ATP synthase subunit gamma [Anaerolineae bacterium]|nr:F0F1 ATP synthase subunit gamma [Anaerolineae bacterium]